MARTCLFAYNCGVRTILKKLLGVLCIICGALLGLVPLVPGIVLVVIGLDLLGVPILPWQRIKTFFRIPGRKELDHDEHDQR